jgi:hypothetical protein
MTDREERKKRLREASRRSAAAADKDLADELDRLRQAQAADLAALKPQLSDQAAFDALVKAVRESTAANETKAQLRKRMKELGEGVLRVAREAAGLLKP